VVKEIIESKPKFKFFRGLFSGSGASSLDFKYVYLVLDADYGIYMDKQQAIYLEFFKEFEKWELNLPIQHQHFL